jgi:CTP:molybdopterin cytidylyltransferase MocA
MTTAMRDVVAVVPAAGASRRFGSAKLLHDVDGEPLVAHTLRALLEGGVARVVLVVSPALDLAVVPVVSDPRITIVTNPDPNRGMFSSILAGLCELREGESALILPADMPFVRSSTVAVVVAAHRVIGDAVVAAYEGQRGHPLVVPERVWRAVRAETTAPSLKAALSAVGVEPACITVDDAGVLRDVDERCDLP